jgi:predicted ATPase
MRWPFTGRDAELALVREALTDGSAGGVVIAGPAGVGKTRLAAEAAELAGAQGCAVAWVRATRSARSIPLGAFAALLPATDRRLPEGVELLARARHALAERAEGRRLVLCVDDGQLLDDASAALLHQLVAAGEAIAVVSVRRDEPGPDALRALWKDELCVLLGLAELARGDVQALLDAALDGPIDGRSVNALWELTRGNALFLRELVRHGVDRGLLAQDDGLWRWRGEVRAGTGWPSSSKCTSTTSARADAACWSWWRSALRWRSGCSRPPSWPLWMRWSAASSSSAARTGDGGSSTWPIRCTARRSARG